MNTVNDNLVSRWPMLKGEARKRWVKLTDEDLNCINGKTDEFIRVLQRRYGYAKVQAGMEINKWLFDYDQKNQKARKARKNIKSERNEML